MVICRGLAGSHTTKIASCMFSQQDRTGLRDMLDAYGHWQHEELLAEFIRLTSLDDGQLEKEASDLEYIEERSRMEEA